MCPAATTSVAEWHRNVNGASPWNNLSVFFLKCVAYVLKTKYTRSSFSKYTVFFLSMSCRRRPNRGNATPLFYWNTRLSRPIRIYIYTPTERLADKAISWCCWCRIWKCSSAIDDAFGDARQRAPQSGNLTKAGVVAWRTDVVLYRSHRRVQYPAGYDLPERSRYEHCWQSLHFASQGILNTL